MSLPRYPAYKPSGVEWLGEVPEHWNAAPIKRFGLLKGGAGFPHENQGQEDEELSFHKVNALGKADHRGVLPPSENTITRETAKKLGAFVFPPSAIVFAKVGAALLMGRIRVLKRDACIDNNMMGLVVHSETHDFHFAMYAMQLVHFDLIANPGAVPSINEGQIGNFKLAVPPVEEQRYITTFLDHETAKIDALISEQKHLIELLQEKRQAVISHAVTKGLNPNTPMKDSGVEWLGEVPEHWAILKLKYLASFSGGGTPSRENLAFWNGDIPWVSPKDMKVERVVDSEETITEIGLQNSSSKLQAAGQVLMVVRSGILQHTIPVAINEVPVALNQDMKAINFGSNPVISEFFMRWVQGLNSLLLLAWAKQGATVESIEQSYLAETIIVIPNLLESAGIISYLEVELVKFDSLASETHRAINLLQERRSSIISAAVTGQIDVRGLVEAEACEQ